MQEKIYKARFFNKDSGIEITLDEAQSISETGRLIKILFHFIFLELNLQYDLHIFLPMLPSFPQYILKSK